MRAGLKTLATLPLISMAFIANSALANDSLSSDPAKTAGPLPVACKSPRSPIYHAKDANDAVEMTMMGDFNGLNDPQGRGRYQAKIYPAVVAIKNGSRGIEYSAVQLTTRGDSRGSYCQATPFRMRFVDDQTQKTIEAKLSSENLSPGGEGYLNRYYELLKATTLDPQAQLTATGKGIFKHVGNDLKIVTHCGSSKDFTVLGGKDEAAQTQKVYGEYYIYKIFELLHRPVESVRLAHIQYLDPTGNPVYAKETDASPDYKVAFIREQSKSIAERCGLLSKKPIDKNPAPLSSATDRSAVEADFMEKWIANEDYFLSGHNVNLLYDAQGNTYYGPYDFDLADVFTDGYRSGLQSAQANFRRFLANADHATLAPIATETLGQRAAIQSLLDQSPLDQNYRAKFQSWLETSMEDIAKAFGTSSNAPTAK